MNIPEILKGLLSFLIVFGILIGLTEIGLRIYTHYRIFYDIEMSRYAMTLKIESDDPAIGHEHRPNSSATLMGVPVRINSDGFRDQEYDSESKSGVRRIAILGDSLTFGWGVNEEDSFAHLIEEDLNSTQPTEAVNFGTGNYNTQQEVRLFKKKGPKYDFDEVILFYFINDAEPTPQKSKYEFLGNVRTISFFWSRVKVALGRFSEAGSFSEYYSALYRDGEHGFEQMKSAFDELHRFTEEHGIELNVVLLPELHNLVDYPFGDEYAKVSSHLDSLGIENVDLTGVFAGEENPHELWVALDDAHPNARAHRMIAEGALEFIKDGPVQVQVEVEPIDE